MSSSGEFPGIDGHLRESIEALKSLRRLTAQSDLIRSRTALDLICKLEALRAMCMMCKGEK
jgi:hypothetical protein